MLNDVKIYGSCSYHNLLSTALRIMLSYFSLLELQAGPGLLCVSNTKAANTLFGRHCILWDLSTIGIWKVVNYCQSVGKHGKTFWSWYSHSERTFRSMSSQEGGSERLKIKLRYTEIPRWEFWPLRQMEKVEVSINLWVPIKAAAFRFTSMDAPSSMK